MAPILEHSPTETQQQGANTLFTKIEVIRFRRSTSKDIKMMELHLKARVKTTTYKMTGKEMTARALLFTLWIVTAFSWAHAQEPISKHFLTQVAIGGQDPVAYHEPNQTYSTEGEKQWEFEWNGAIWRFADQSSMKKFASDPERYIPEFGGHCANALSLGEGLIRTNGTVWQFFDGRLYLFFAPRGLTRWSQGDYQVYLNEAEQAWRDITQPNL